MPEILKKPNGNIDWGKFFMGLSVALVFLIQSINQMQHYSTRTEINSIHKEYVPRPEINEQLEVNKENIKRVLQDINRRLKALEYEELPKTKTNMSEK